MESLPKIVLLCGGPFAYRSISALAFEGFLCGVVIGSSETFIVESLRKECEQSSVPFINISSSSEVDLLSNWINEINPDAVFSVCFPYLIPGHILTHKTRKFLNFHTGPLPEFRGPMPIFEVVRRREKETAMTAHFMTESFDTGAVIYSETITVLKGDTFTSLALKLSERCGIMVINMAQMLQFSSKIPASEQSEHGANFYQFPKKEELKIDWTNMDADTIIALINACNGWNNGAVSSFNTHEIHLIAVDSEPIFEFNIYKPGTIIELFTDGSAELACINNQKVKVKQFGTEDGLYSYEFLKQMGIKNGELLG